MQHVAYDILFLIIVIVIFIGIVKGVIPVKRKSPRNTRARNRYSRKQ